VAEDWRPGADAETLCARAERLRIVRRFFELRGVLEVETPLLCRAGVTDLQLASLAVETPDAGRRWLQTSPEYAIKRLLAAGVGACYQITRGFRAGEAGRLHNPEFSLLEWYRPGFDQYALMREVAELCGEVMAPRPVQFVSYRDAFLETLALDPLRVDSGRLREVAMARLGPADWIADAERDELLDALAGGVICPALGHGNFTFLTGFPADQAALARRDPANPEVAERFELFIDGVEIANGFHELADAVEQRQRFEDDRAQRARRGLPPMDVDERLLAALGAGLPDASGVALGLDRLMMIALGKDDLDSVMAFSWDRA
jgi:lysyl-tRNA synthetase class 2